MSLPTWLEDFGLEGCKTCGWTYRSHKWFEALSIALEALEKIDPPLNSSEHGCWKIAREAKRRIEELGKETNGRP